jgi:hypothetical protein
VTNPFALPAPLTGAHGKFVSSAVTAITSLIPKALIVDNLTNLNNFVKLASDTPNGNPVRILSGELVGVGALRYRDKMLSDNFKVTARVGHNFEGKTWLVTCCNETMDRYYALEIETNLGGQNYMSIVAGTTMVVTRSTGLFGIIIGQISFLLGLFGDIVSALFTRGRQFFDVVPGDEVSIWWDQTNSIVYGYINNTVVVTLPVARHEIPHNEDSRYFGVVAGVGFPNPGTHFNRITAQDV